MSSLLKKYFIPHEGNDHKPHILRWTTIRVVLVVLVGLEVLFLTQVSFISNKSSFMADIVGSVLVSETNQNRVTNSDQALSVSPLLQQAAQLKADDMVKNDYFAHTSPTGVTPWYWMQQVGYNYSYAGENLAVNFVDSNDVMNAWMNSPEHRSNILNGNFTQIGIGIAQGQYEGKQATFVVQMFGAPLEPAVVASNSAPLLKVVQQQTGVIAKQTTSSAATPTAVLGAETAAPEKGTALPQPSLVEKAISSPSATTNWLLAAISALFVLALCLKMFIKIKIQYPSLILNGVIVVLLIDSMLLFNRYIALAQLKII